MLWFFFPLQKHHILQQIDGVQHGVMEIQNNHWVIKLIGITIVKLLEAKWGGGVQLIHKTLLSWQKQLVPEVTLKTVMEFGFKMCRCASISTSAGRIVKKTDVW